MRYILAIVLAAVLVGCVTSPPVTDADRERTFTSTEYGILFDAAKAAVYDIGAELQDASKESGFLAARKHYSGSEMMTAIVLGSIRTIYIHYKVSFFQDTFGFTIRTQIYSSYSDDSYHTEAPQEYYKVWWDSLYSRLGL